MAGINLASGFNRTSANPLDLYAVVADTTARDAIPGGVRYLGMIVFTVATTEFWTLKTGLTDGDWELFGGGGLTSWVVPFALEFAIGSYSGSGTIVALDMSGYSVISIGNTVNIQGIDSSSIGTGSNPIFVFINTSSGPITIENMSVSAAIGDKIRTGTGSTLTVENNAAIWGIYTGSVFQVIGGSGGDGVSASSSQAIANGGTISLDRNKTKQTIFISNSGTGDCILDIQPFGVLFPFKDDSEITLIGDEDADPCVIDSNDIGQYGAFGNFGRLTFYRGYSATFKWNATIEKYICISRNF